MTHTAYLADLLASDKTGHTSVSDYLKTLAERGIFN
jgi:hypothetical protein